MIKKKLITNKQRGFTLIEIMTAVSIFAVVTTISMGSILSVFDVNRKSESIKSVMDNLNLAVESIAREMRFGINYICNPSLPILGNMPSPSNCQNGDTSIAFLATDKVTKIVYRLNSSSNFIEKSRDGGQTFVRVTAPEIIIEDLDFFVVGALPSVSESGNPQQPKVLIRIRGEAGSKEVAKTEFTIQTLVSQRNLDNQ